jgi:hypothetical protein
MARAKVVYKTKKSGMRMVLNSEGMQRVVTQAARDIRSRANTMFGASSYGLSEARPGKMRCHAIVYTGDRYAMRSNAVHQTLLKAINS